MPVQIVSRPKHLSALAKEYLNIPSPYTEVEAGYAVDLETLTISFRDHELAKLQWVFGEIAKFYSSKAAEELFRLGLRTFIDKKGKFWSIWIELLSGDLEIYTPVSGFLCQCKAPRFRTRLKYSVSVISQPSILRASFSAASRADARDYISLSTSSFLFSPLAGNQTGTYLERPGGNFG